FPVLLVLVPIFDTGFVVVTRLLRGRSVAQGGRDHTSHRLVALGMSERGALFFMLGISAVSALLAIASYRHGFRYSVILLTLLVIGLALLGVHLGRAQRSAARSASAGAPVLRLLEELPYKRQLATLVIDVVSIVIAYYAAYLLRFENAFAMEQGRFIASIGPILGLQILALAASGSYRGLWLYTSVSDLLRLFRAATLGVGARVVSLVLTTRFEAFSRAVFVLDWVLLILLLGSSRFAYRLLGERLRPTSAGSRPALIYGAGEGGVLTLRELRS